jgi:Glucodextranase, domain B
MSRTSRLALACLVLAILGSALPGVANAAFTSSNVSAPADPFTQIVDLRGGATPTITVSGTVSGQSPGDKGMVICDHGGTSFDSLSLAIDVSSGSFSTSVSAQDIAGRNCVLRFVPDTTTGATDRTPFTGPRAYGGTLNDERFSGSPNDGVITDAWVILSPRTIGSNLFVYSMGSCGIGIAPPLATQPFYADFAWDCVGYYYRTDEGTTATSSEAKVDNHTAYVPGMGGLSSHAEGAAGLAPVDFHPSYDPATGVLTIDETGIVQRCTGTDAPDPTAATCGAKADTGVRVTRHWVTGADGVSATLTETWSVADGGTHQIALIPEADTDNSAARFDFPWLGNGYVNYTGDPSLPGPGPGAGPVSMFVVSDDPGSGSPTLSYGGLTVNPPPDSIQFYGTSPGTGNQYPQIAYSRTITPSQPFSYTWKLSVGLSDATVRARAAVDADSLAAPVVKITAPANGSKTTKGKTTVTGTATDNGGVSSFTVNGKAVALGAGGAFSTIVPLKVGANTITAQASDKTGNTTKATVALTRIRQCVVPRLKGKKLSSARRALRRSHCKLGKVKKAYRTHLTGKRGHRIRVPFKTGRIIAQRPHAGARKKVGTKVSVVVQKAKP